MTVNPFKLKAKTIHFEVLFDQLIDLVLPCGP